MKIWTLVVLIVLMFVAAATPPKQSAASAKAKRIKRGEYLVTVGGCHDCHTPKSNPAIMALDESRLLSGRPPTTAAPQKPARMGEITASGDLTAWHGPWGVSYAANLTADPETGLGRRYNQASFINTMRTGKKPEGEPLLPPMPWPNYAHMTDEDLKAIWAYLQSLEPVKNFVRQASPPPAGR